MKKIALFVILALVFLGCAKESKIHDNTSASKDEAANSVTAFSVTHAKLFSIDYLENGIKRVTDYEGNRLLLVPRDAPLDVRHGADTIIRTPVERAFFMSATAVGILESLNIGVFLDSIAAVTFEPSPWQFIPQDAAGAVNMETVIALNPDIIFASAAIGGADAFAPFKNLGLPYAVSAEWLETDSLSAMEWVRFIAAFYNADAEADRIFAEKAAVLRAMDEGVAAIPETARPVVAYGLLYRGTVYTQGGKSPLAEEYERRGALYYLAGDTHTGMIQISLETFLEKAYGADVYICSSLRTYIPTKAALLGESLLFAEMKAFQTDRVYVLSDTYYLNGAKVDEKIADTLAIFHPSFFPFPPGEKFYVLLQ